MDCTFFKLLIGLLTLTGSCLSKLVTVSNCPGCSNELNLTCSGKRTIHLTALYFTVKNNTQTRWYKNAKARVCKLCAGKRKCTNRVDTWYGYRRFTAKFSCRGPSYNATGICDQQQLRSTTVATHTSITTATSGVLSPVTSLPTSVATLSSSARLSDTTKAPSAQTTVLSRETTDTGDRPRKLSTGELVGIVAWALVLVILVVAGVCVLKRRLRPPRPGKVDKSVQNLGNASNHALSPSNNQQGTAYDEINIGEAAYAMVPVIGDTGLAQRSNNEDYDKIRFHGNGAKFTVEPDQGALKHAVQDNGDSRYNHVTLSGTVPQTSQSDLYSHLRNSGSHGNKRDPDADDEDLYNHCNGTKPRLAVDPDFDCYSHLSSRTDKPTL